MSTTAAIDITPRTHRNFLKIRSVRRLGFKGFPQRLILFFRWWLGTSLGAAGMLDLLPTDRLLRFWHLLAVGRVDPLCSLGHFHRSLSHQQDLEWALPPFLVPPGPPEVLDHHVCNGWSCWSAGDSSVAFTGAQICSGFLAPELLILLCGK